MDIFINSFEAITPQDTFDSTSFLAEITERTSEYFTCQTPKYSEYLDPKALRRMSKIVRMGTACSKLTLQKSNIENPDAIIVGTGLGCIEDTVKFLAQMIENYEQLLNPTAFIQSTHNTVSGQIALMLGCKNYNFTYTQKSLSFETALLDAFLMLKGNEAKNILVGGIDEVTDESYRLIKTAGCAYQNNDNKGFTPGEGSAFFLTSNEKSDKNTAILQDIAIANSFSNNEDFEKFIANFLKKNNITKQEIDLVICGNNGDKFNDVPHKYVSEIFNNSLISKYKHICGEYDTASAFSLWIATNVIKNQTVPDCLTINNSDKGNFKNILIYNSFNQKNHSLILVSKC